MATEEDILLGHSPEYLDKLKASANMTQQQLMDLSSTFDGVYFHRVSILLSNEKSELT